MSRLEKQREQVLEVIVRHAIAGAPWREICAGPMDAFGITVEEVEAAANERGGVGSARPSENFFQRWSRAYYEKSQFGPVTTVVAGALSVALLALGFFALSKRDMSGFGIIAGGLALALAVALTVATKERKS